MHPEEYKEENYLTAEGIKLQLKKLQGQVLTLIEATANTELQADAQKSIVNSYFNERYDVVFKKTHYPLEVADNQYLCRIK